MQERAAAINRRQQTLEGANITLAAVATDVTGVSARALLERLVAGATDPRALADLARGRLRALAGQLRPHHRFLVAEILGHIDDLDERLARLDIEVRERQRPFDEAIARLDAVPGIGRQAAEIILAELGVDLGRFPTAGHCAAWAGLCPGNDESAGKRSSGRTRQGNPYRRAVLIQSAMAAARVRDSSLAAQYRRLARRLGKTQAAVAVAHSLLVSISHLLTSPDAYRDLGGDYFDRRDRLALEHRHIRGLQRLGYAVELKPKGKRSAYAWMAGMSEGGRVPRRAA